MRLGFGIVSGLLSLTLTLTRSLSLALALTWSSVRRALGPGLMNQGKTARATAETWPHLARVLGGDNWGTVIDFDVIARCPHPLVALG